MGILNATPDSFYDGGKWVGAAAISKFDALVAEGADIIDVGGESTRPGSALIPATTQIARIDGILQHAARARVGVLVTVDTSDPSVAEYALRMGADAINDTSCLANPALAGLTADKGAGLIVMHTRGPMSKMAGYSNTPDSAYDDIVRSVTQEWRAARATAMTHGMPEEDIFFDPGIGFWKSARQSLEVLRRVDEFRVLGAPILIGASRKSFLMLAEPSEPAQRLGSSIAASLYAARRGVHIVRVHDVACTRQALRLERMLQLGSPRAAHAGDAMGEAC